MKKQSPALCSSQRFLDTGSCRRSFHPYPHRRRYGWVVWAAAASVRFVAFGTTTTISTTATAAAPGQNASSLYTHSESTRRYRSAAFLGKHSSPRTQRQRRDPFTSSSSSSSFDLPLPPKSMTSSSANNDTNESSFSSPSSSSSSSSSSWDDADTRRSMLTRCILPLDAETSHKGSSGRVGVLGGSALYTGAPYYASMSALQTGADLVTLWTAAEAAPALKAYSPEAMVQPIYQASVFDQAVKKRQRKKCKQQQPRNDNDSDDATMEWTIDNMAAILDELPSDDPIRQAVEDMVETVTENISRYHALIVGPGLGRCPVVGYAVGRILRIVREECPNMPVVLDADALWCLSRSTEVWQDGVARDNAQLICTPNQPEYHRLQEASSSSSSSSYLNKATIIIKGKVDRISVGLEAESQQMVECTEPGGLKRSGGIGDILAGATGAMAAWQSILRQEQSRSAHQPDAHTWTAAAWTACHVVRRTTRVAWQDQKRAMTAPDILARLGRVFDEMIGQEYNEKGS